MAGQQRAREAALERANLWSPFLKGLLERQPRITEIFLRDGASSALAAVGGPPDRPLGDRLRIERQQLALATALGDLAGELSLEQVTAALSDFADRALDQCLAAAIAERHPDAMPTGMTILALGKLGSRELNYSSDVDLILLFDPDTLPRRPRQEAGEAAVRYGRRLIELMQARDEHGYVARVDMRLRP